MQDFNFLKHDRVVPLPDNVDLSILSYTELVSVSLHAINRFEMNLLAIKDTKFCLPNQLRLYGYRG